MHTETIYRKYRPSNFASLLGQDKITSILTAQITQGRLAHAYLFTGPRGTGKTSTARIFAKAINCLNWNGDVCNECANCLLINNEGSVDIIEIDAASNRGIDEIRKVKEGVNYLPSQLKHKVYIVDEAHMLTKDAFNSLLKTLEEPPEHVVFVLATTEPNKLPETILSRVQRYDFRLAHKAVITDKMAKIISSESLAIDTAVLDVIYHLSRGSFRDAESLLGKVIAHGSAAGNLSIEEIHSILGIPLVQDLQQLHQHLIAQDKQSIIGQIDRILQNGIEPLVLVNEFMHFLQAELLASTADEFVFKALNELSRRYQEIKLGHDSGMMFKLVILASLEKYQLLAVSMQSANNAQNTQPAIIQNNATAGSVAVEAKVEEPKNDFIPVNGSETYDFGPVLDEVSRMNSRLGAILSTCEVKYFTPNRLTLATNFVFNQEILKKMNSKQLIISIAKKYYPSMQIRDVETVLIDNPIVAAVPKAESKPTEATPSPEDPADDNPDSGARISADNKSLIESIL